MPVARSTAFASFDAQPRSSEGINGALTPARSHRTPQSRGTKGTAKEIYPANNGPGTPRRQQERRRSSGALTGHKAAPLAAGEGISLQETEARIGELERSEFDLKLKLFYMEEQLKLAVGGADALHLHKETMEARMHRAQAEQQARLAGESLSELEAKTLELESQVRDVEAQRMKDRENWAIMEGQNEARLQRHTRLLEDALKTERAENTRLRLVVGTQVRRGSWDGTPQQSKQQSKGTPRRRSVGFGGLGQGPSRSGGGSGGLGRESREQQVLAAKIRNQDSSLRSLRADVTTLRRRLRTQGETLAKQKEENVVVRQAAEQVACVEAEEIAKLARDLEQAIEAAHAEAEARRQAEKRLAAAENFLSMNWENGGGPVHRPMSPLHSPPGGSVSRNPGCGDVQVVRERGRAHTVDFPAIQVPQFSPARYNYSERGSRSLPPPPPPTLKAGALGSTIASRAKLYHSNGRKELAADFSKGKGRLTTTSPRSNRGADPMTIEHRRSWGSCPPISPRHRTADEFGTTLPRGHRDPEAKEQRRPWGSPPPPSTKHRTGDVSGSSFAARRRDSAADANAETPSSADIRQFLRQYLSESNPDKRAFASTAPSGVPVWLKDDPERTTLFPSGGGGGGGGAGTEEPYGTGSTQRYVDRREMESHEVRLGEFSPTLGWGGGQIDGDGDAIADGSADSEAATITHFGRERKQSVGSGAGGGDGQGKPSVAEAIAAAIRGVDLTETIARELRAAVAPAPSPASPCPTGAGGANVLDCGGGGDGGGGTAVDRTKNDRRREIRDREHRPENRLGCLEGEGDSLNFAKHGVDARSARVGDGKTAAGGKTSVDGGRCSKSREVAELESDVQHIFQFFAAKDGGKRSGSSGTGRRGEWGGGRGGFTADVFPP